MDGNSFCNLFLIYLYCSFSPKGNSVFGVTWKQRKNTILLSLIITNYLPRLAATQKWEKRVHFSKAIHKRTLLVLRFQSSCHENSRNALCFSHSYIYWRDIKCIGLFLIKKNITAGNSSEWLSEYCAVHTSVYCILFLWNRLHYVTTTVSTNAQNN